MGREFFRLNRHSSGIITSDPEPPSQYLHLHCKGGGRGGYILGVCVSFGVIFLYLYSLIGTGYVLNLPQLVVSAMFIFGYSNYSFF